MTDEQKTDERPDPTTAEAAKIAAAGAEAITKSDDPAKAEADAATAIEKKADELGVKVSPEDAAMIAAATIDALEARGAFEAPTGEARQEETLDTTTHEPSGEHEASEKEDHGEHHEHDPEDTPPRKSSFASRYLGKKGGGE
jgi:hypothetical protein